jgi:hypothetical protein
MSGTGDVNGLRSMKRISGINGISFALGIIA